MLDNATDDATLTLDQATAVTNDDSTGLIQVDAHATLALDDASITDGDLTVAATGLLTSAHLNDALHNVDVDNDGTIEVLDNAADNATLTLDQATAVTNDDSTGLIQIDTHATLALDNASITDGDLTVAATGLLTSAHLNDALHNVDVTNNGTVEVLDNATDNATLTLDQATAVTNDDSTGLIQVDAHATLALDDASITDGDLTVAATGKLTSAHLNDALHNVDVDNDGTIEVLDNATDDATLTLDQATAVTNDDSTGLIQVDAHATLALDNASITDGDLTVAATGKLTSAHLNDALHNVDVDNDGTIEVLDNAGNNATLTFDQTTAVTNTGGLVKIDAHATLALNDASITDGDLTVAATGKLTSANAADALHNVDVDNNGTIEVLDNAADNATLTLDQTTAVTNTGGLVKIDAHATLALNDASITDGDLTVAATGKLTSANAADALHNVDVDNNGTIEVLDNAADNATLTLDQTTAVTNTGGLVKIDAHATLALNDASITAGDLTVAATGKLTSANAADALHNVDVDNNGTIEVLDNAADNAKLTLDQTAAVTNTGGLVKIDAHATVALNDASITDGDLTVAATGKLTSAHLNDALHNVDVDNDGTIEVLDNAGNNAKLTLDQTTAVTNTGGLVKIDANATVALSNASITDGDLHVLGNGKLTSAHLNDALHNVDVDNDGTIEVLDNAGNNATLTFDQTTAVTDTGGLVKVDAHATLALNNASISDGDLHVFATGQIEATGGTSTIRDLEAGDFINDGAIVVFAGATLVFENDTVEGTGNIQIDGTLQITGDVVLGDDITTSTTGAAALTGSSGDDTISLTGPQLNTFTTIDLDGGTDTIFLRSTSTTLNALSNANLANVETISAAGSAAGVIINLSNQTEAFTIIGGDHADTITGGSGADNISAGSGDDLIVGAQNDTLLDGGADTDTLQVGANFTSTNNNQIKNIEIILLTGAVTLNLSNQTEGFTITGTSGADIITGGSGADTITGGGGADTLVGGGGGDTFNLANGDFAAGESITGGSGTDKIVLTNATTVDFTTGTLSGIQTLTGSSGNDTVTLSAVQWAELSTINLGTGTNVLNVAASGNISALGTPSLVNITTGNLTGTGGNDTVTLTGAQLDAIIIGTGTINLGGGGSDTINLTSTSDDLNTLGATDASIQGVEIISAATAASDVTITLSAQTEAFTVTGSSHDDTITGGLGADSISAGDGDDVIVGAQNDTLLDGGANADTLRVGASFTSSSDAQIVNIETVELTAAGTTLNLSNQTEGFTITGSSGADTITGGSGADNISAGSGDDLIVGAQNDTLLDGGADTDTLQVGANFTSTNNNQIKNIEIILLTGAVTLNLSNQTEGFTITGTSGADIITGGSGADTITGGGGADTLVGGGGGDTFNLANGDFAAGELITGGSGTDKIVLTNATTVDFTTGTLSGIQTLTGSSGNDTVTLSAVQWAEFSTINLGTGTNVLNVAASGNISALGTPSLVNITTGNLTGTGGNDTVTLTGAQLDAIIIGTGTINLGGGSSDTINLTSTSDDLNTLGATDASIQGVEIISAATAASDVTITLSAQTEAFTVTGSSHDDTITGGLGADSISAGDGDDVIVGAQNDTLLDGGS